MFYALSILFLYDGMVCSRTLLLCLHISWAGVYSTTPHSIAKQLHDSKIALEAQIRAELEAEYHNSNSSQQRQNGHSSASSNNRDLEDQLRKQLLQVAEERKRWTIDQEEINQKLIHSQHQFEKVREGFKSTFVFCVL